MWVCIVIYVCAAVGVWIWRKGKIPQWCEKKVWRQMLCVLLLSNTLGLLLTVIDGRESAPQRQAVIERNSYGEGSRMRQLEAEIEGEETPLAVEVRVGAQEYSKEEIRKMFSEITEQLDLLIRGENASLDAVTHPLNLMTEVPGYPVKISWESDHSSVLDAEGNIAEDQVPEEGVLIELRGTLLCQEENELYVTNVMVCPREKTRQEKLTEAVMASVEQAEEATREDARFSLPDRIDGREVRWSEKREERGAYIALLGVVSAALVWLLDRQKKEKRQRERAQQMMLDYAEIVNQFVLMIGAGMTVKQAWKRILLEYRETGRTRYAYEEMKYAYHEMLSGVPEAECYERFGRRCAVPAYVKFGSLLSQNLRKGTRGLSEILMAESVQAFEERKDRAKKIGEETGTKLLFPMFLMLAVVLAMILTPAFLSM